MEKGDKMNENPFVLAASTDERSKAPLCMATTCCSILPLPFTGRRVPSRPGRGTTKERRDKIVCFGCSLRPNQNRDALAEKRYPFPLRNRTSSPLCKLQFFIAFPTIFPYLWIIHRCLKMDNNVIITMRFQNDWTWNKARKWTVV